MVSSILPRRSCRGAVRFPVHRSECGGCAGISVAGKRLRIQGVSSNSSVIYDNDWWTDVPDAAYIWAKASLGKCDLRGNIITRCTFGWEKGYAHKLEEQIQDSDKLLKAARASGLKNIPDPILGAKEALRKPESGKVTDTKHVPSPGSDLIVAEATKATSKSRYSSSAVDPARQSRPRI